jgi:hypothetical protein
MNRRFAQRTSRRSATRAAPSTWRDQGTQWNALPVPLPVQASVAQPAQFAQTAPGEHCESLVHQQGTPAAVHLPVGVVTVLQLPIEHDHAFATEVAVWQSSLSAGLAPEHAPAPHWELPLMHLPLGQFESATHRQAVWPLLRTGVGVSVVVQTLPPLPAQATELGATWQP